MAKKQYHRTPPAEAQTETTGATCRLDPEGAEITRRNFLKLGITALGVIAALEAGGASLIYLRSHSLKDVFGSIIDVGRVEAFQPGSITEYPDARFFLIRASDGGFLALHTRCPHLGCSVIWVPEKEQFLCPCHAADFDSYGAHGKPPVTRALDMFPVTIKDGAVRVDTTTVVQRETYSADQLTYA
jgi:cytochrome b6-f complex iron-sulfur subunit